MDFAPMLRNLTLSAGAIGAGLVLSFPAQADTLQIANNHTDGGQMTPTTEQSDAAMNIVNTASNSESFNTLVQALQAADLTDTLSGEGPYTVFAPTDDAFNQLPDGALDFLLQPENKDLLVQVLSYHVVPQSVMADQLTSGGVDTLDGGIAVGVSDSGIVVNNASVVNPDIQASNGVIHSINRVLIPEALQQQLASRLGVSDLY